MTEEAVPVKELEDRGLQDWDLLCEMKHLDAAVLVLGVPVGIMAHDCGRPADWITTCRSCGRTGYLCDPDRQRVGQKIGCSSCGVRGTVYFDFVRIPRPAAD